MKRFIFNKSVLIILSIFFFSCNNRKLDYIDYYKEVNKIDSLYRFTNQPILAVKKYKLLFKKYPPKNQEKLREYETYITLAYKNNISFGGKKSLKQLISLIGPYTVFGLEKQYYPIFNKYGMDSIIVKKEINKWNNSINNVLLDSFSIAMERDQKYRSGIYEDFDKVKIVNNKNAQLFKWSFEKYGYPSLSKIGFGKKQNFQINMYALLLHMAESDEYPYLKNKLYEYVKKGDCPPEYYTSLVDRYESRNNNRVVFGSYNLFVDKIDSIQVDSSRKDIGLPSLNHQNRLIKDRYSLKNLLK